MEDYKVRFIKEYSELHERIWKLNNMIKKYYENTLDFTPTCDIKILQMQLEYMRQYELVLAERAKIEDIDLNCSLYRKKPVVVQAYKTDSEADIETLEGTMHADIGDYIITGVNGEKYPCKPDIFEKTYEQVK